MNYRTGLIYAMFVVLITALPFGISNAQEYSFDALRLSKQVPGQDAHSIALGSSSVSQLQGFGSFLINPATAAKLESSYFSVGVGVRDVTQESTFLGQRSTFDDNQTGITHVGFAYRVPTIVGSLVIGGGYVQSADYNSAFSVDVINDWSSRTHQSLNDYTNDIAFNTFAIDFFDDGSNGWMQSVFDFGVFEEDFEVAQYSTTTRRGQSGEYSLLLATEFQEDFFMGLSVGIPVSKSRFEQLFIERDPYIGGNAVYTGNPGSGTFNIESVLFEETIRVDAVGLNARAGILYSGLPMIDIGGSYTTGTRWNIEERFDAFYQTSFKGVVTLDGDEIEDDEEMTFGPELNDNFSGDYSYSVTTPARIQLGVSTKDLPLVNLSASTERINYSRIRLQGFDSADRQIEIDENNFINNEFQDVWNFRAGAAITAFESFEPRIGWAWMSNPIAYIENNNRQYLSAGLGIGINQMMGFDFAVQYGFWDTMEDLYSVETDAGTEFESADQHVERFHATASFQIRF